MGIQPKDSGGGGGETRETVVFRLADDMLEKLPADYLPHEVCLCCEVNLFRLVGKNDNLCRNTIVVGYFCFKTVECFKNHS